MLDQNRIRQMTELARYESGEGREDLRISRYYRSDYIGLGLLKNFIFTTLGYILVWAAIIAYNMDYLLDNLHKVNMHAVLLEMSVGYLIFLVFYSVVTYVKRRNRYEKARRNVERYYSELGWLALLYGEEPLELNAKQSRGGKRP